MMLKDHLKKWPWKKITADLCVNLRPIIYIWRVTTVIENLF